MSTINIKCVDQVLAFQNMPIITAGDQNIDKVKFDFCPLWDGFVKVAVFFKQKTELSYALINADGSCNIPNSIMKLDGQIFIAVTGTNTSNQVRTSNILSYYIGEGIVDASINDEFPGEITEEEKEDIYNKILEMCLEMQALCQDLIDNFAYVRIKDANEFEYDESLMEAKVRAYTYTRNQIDELFNNSQSIIGEELVANVERLEGRISNLENDLSSFRESTTGDIGRLNDTCTNLQTRLTEETQQLSNSIVVLRNETMDLIANLTARVSALES